MGELELRGGTWARCGPRLYARGPIPTGAGVTIVGSRDALPEAASFARDLAAAVAERGWIVWSGGARGVDAAAHRGALAAGGRTVGILAGGLDAPHPCENRALFAEILDRGGALLSMQPDGVVPRRHYFVWRDDLLAAFSAATVLVQARANGGGLYTTGTAVRLGRPVHCVTHPPWIDGAEGSTRFLWKHRERAMPVFGIADLLARLEPSMEAWQRFGPARRQLALGGCDEDRGPTLAELLPLDADSEAVLATLGATPIDLDVVCGRAKLPFPRVSAALFALSVHGRAEEVPPGRWCRVLSSAGG
jgi:DNA processing protein